MIRFAHTVVVEPVPRTWLTTAVTELYALACASTQTGGRIVLPDGTEPSGLRLVKGRHLGRDAVYEVTDEAPDGTPVATRFVLREWSRTGAVRLTHRLVSDEGEITVDTAFSSVEHPRRLTVGALLRMAILPRPLQRIDAEAVLHLDAWWSASEGHPHTATPLRLRVTHRGFRATATAVPEPDGQGRWVLSVTGTAHGRFLLRPVVAVALRLARGRVDRALTQALDSAAARWNEEIPAATAQPPGALFSRESP